MSDQNVDALRPIYAEWSRGNWRPRFDVYSDEMEWGWSEEFPGLEGVGPDPQGAERSTRLRQWLREWDDWRCEAERFVAEDDWVVALTRYHGRGKESGATVDTIGAHVWRFRGGKVVRLEIFSSRDRALEAAGIDCDA
jgi:ketosteroid isomerase-like protein